MDGMSMGSAVAFMITGPSTKITNLGALKIVLGIKNFVIYIAFVMTFSFAALIFIFVAGETESALVYPVYCMSVYSLCILLVAVPTLAAGIRYRSVWFISMAVYYLILGGMRASLVFHHRHRDEKQEIGCCRCAAWLLFLLNIPMGRFEGIVQPFPSHFVATPVAPSFGAPKIPKINTAFNRMFSEKASTFNAVLITTLPMLRRIARYTSIIPQHR